MAEIDTAAANVLEIPSENAVNNHQHGDNHTVDASNDKNSVSNTRKRKAFVLMAESTSKQSGRGSLVGWTFCPLCGRYSTKRFALGRGIASHLYAVHTPWNPGKIERKKRRRLEEERQRLEAARQQRNGAEEKEDKPRPCNDDEQNEKQNFTQLQTWQPTPQEVEAWDAKVLEIVKELEDKAAAAGPSAEDNEAPLSAIGLQRNGEPAKAYRDSLPPFLQAAADGNLHQLETMLKEAKAKDGLMKLLDTRDRHLSTAEHWAAGGGHVDCLKLLLQARKDNDASNGNSQTKNRKIRRRDGKTCLHYAARNGQIECAKYLLDVECYSVDDVSGDGTTPLHLACYGLHFQTVRYLIERGANVKATNEWGCSAAHWMAMASTGASTTNNTNKTSISSTQSMRDLATLLKEHGVSFVEKQKQGHSAMHKAAQRLNRPLLEWLAHRGGAGLTKEELQAGASKDDGGHTPSAIWRSVGGDSGFAKWMVDQGW